MRGSEPIQRGSRLTLQRVRSTSRPLFLLSRGNDTLFSLDRSDNEAFEVTDTILG